MHILILGPAYPLRGGIAHFNALLGSHLERRGHRVETITFKRQYPKLFFPGKTQKEQGEPLAGVTAAPQLIDSVNPLNWIKVGRRLRKLAPDLIIFKYWLPFFGPCMGTIAKVAKRNGITKVLFVCDNILPHERRPGDAIFTRYAFKSADYFLVQSRTVEADLNRLFPDAVYRYAPHPIYEIFGQVIPKSEARRRLGITAKRIILFFGYVRPYKGLMVLIDSMKTLTSHFGGPNEILLLVVGEFYDDESKYRTHVRKLGLESSVSFVSDYVPNDQVALYFSAADAVILPYLSATQSGIAQIAFNFERPVIATDVGGLSEVIVDGITGVVVSPNDPQGLADGVERCFEAGSLQTMEANVRVEKAKYSWTRFVMAIEEISRP